MVDLFLSSCIFSNMAEDWHDKSSVVKLSCIVGVDKTEGYGFDVQQLVVILFYIETRMCVSFIFSGVK